MEGQLDEILCGTQLIGPNFYDGRSLASLALCSGSSHWVLKAGSNNAGAVQGAASSATNAKMSSQSDDG